MCIKYALFQRNDIVFIHVVLGQTKMASAKKWFVRIANFYKLSKRNRSTENEQYLHPGYFFWVAIDPCMIQVSKELYVLLSRRLSGCLTGQGQMYECRWRLNAPTSHPAGASVTPRHLRRDDFMMRGAWKVVQMISLFIRLTK
jgi:hypothetical protein